MPKKTNSLQNQIAKFLSSYTIGRHSKDNAYPIDVCAFSKLVWNKLNDLQKRAQGQRNKTVIFSEQVTFGFISERKKIVGIGYDAATININHKLDLPTIIAAFKKLNPDNQELNKVIESVFTSLAQKGVICGTTKVTPDIAIIKVLLMLSSAIGDSDYAQDLNGLALDWQALAKYVNSKKELQNPTWDKLLLDLWQFIPNNIRPIIRLPVYFNRLPYNVGEVLKTKATLTAHFEKRIQQAKLEAQQTKKNNQSWVSYFWGSCCGPEDEEVALASIRKPSRAKLTNI